MKLVWMDHPRPGQQVQCVKCHKMINGQEALADLNAHAGTFYHPTCVPHGERLPGLTPAQVAAAKKTYDTPREWDAYIDTCDRGHEGKVTGRETFTVKAHSRIEAFDRVREKAVEYDRKHPRKIACGQGVAHVPRLTR